MKTNTQIVIAFFILSSLVTNILFASDKTGVSKLPYDSLFQIHELMSKKMANNQTFRLLVYSSDPEVISSDITIQLVSKNETIEIMIDNCGYIDLPIRKDLVGVGAFVVTNQLKGTLVLEGLIESQIPLANKKIFYRDLISPLIIAQSAKKIEQSTTDIDNKPHNSLNSIKISIGKDNYGPVVIRFNNGKKIELIPDKLGHLEILIEDKLMKENPIVEFPNEKAFYISIPEI